MVCYVFEHEYENEYVHEDAKAVVLVDANRGGW